MNAWSWFLYTVLFFCGIVFSYIFIHPILSIVLTLMWIYGIIGYAVSDAPIHYEEEIANDSEENWDSFVSDFAAYKVGEWLNKRH